jgi:cyclohexadieny/prephenate dehydrogenase
MGFSRISILGVGLLGGSIGLALHQRAKGARIIGYGHRRETLDRAMQLGAIDEAHDDPAGAVREADLVILCTPVGTFPELLRRMSPALARGAIVTDVGSTKRSVVELAEALLPPTVHFVGSHPMAGSEKRGVEVARADLFDNALCITSPTGQTDPDGLERVEQFWKQLGMRITRLSPMNHDRLLAQVSHLPHALAAALVAMQPSEALALAGKGFMDATRIAAGDAGLWRDIFLDNRDQLEQAVNQLRHQLDEFAALLDPARADDLTTWLAAAARKREQLAP